MINAKNDTCAFAVQNVSHKKRGRSETMWKDEVGGWSNSFRFGPLRGTKVVKKKQTFVHVVIE